MRILDETYEVDRDLPFEQLKVVGKDLDEVVRQHGEFQSFEKQTIDQLDRLEMAQLYYLYQKFPSFDWARQKFESIKKKLQLNYSSEEVVYFFLIFKNYFTFLSNLLHLFIIPFHFFL